MQQEKTMTTPISTIGDTPQQPGIRSTVYIPDQLIAGPLQLVTETITLAAGQLRRGALLGRKDDGAYTLSVKNAEDGSQRPIAILADDADASGGPVSAGAYLMGEFNQDALYVYPDETGWTIAEVKPLLRAVGIFLKNAVTAADPH
jgi:hypothetical protein